MQFCIPQYRRYRLTKPWTHTDNHYWSARPLLRALGIDPGFAPAPATAPTGPYVHTFDVGQEFDVLNMDFRASAIRRWGGGARLRMFVGRRRPHIFVPPEQFRLIEAEEA